MNRKPKRRIENKIIGKIVRTLSFVLLTISGLFITVHFLTALNIGGSIANPIVDLFNKMTFLTPDVIVYLLFGGMLLLVGSQTKTWTGRVIVSLIMLVGTFTMLNLGDSSIITGYNFLSKSQLDFIKLPILGENFVFLPIVGLFALTFWGVIAYRRPIRLSQFLVRLGAIALVVAIILTLIPEFGVTVGQTYIKVIMYFYFANYGLLTVGSLLGIIGFFRS